MSEPVMYAQVYNGEAWVPLTVPGPAPDWADVREAARNAGWERRQLARDWWFWRNEDASVHLRRRWDGGWKVTLAGEFGDLVLNQPTPARFVALCRLVGLGGDSDEHLEADPAASVHGALLHRGGVHRERTAPAGRHP